MPESNKKQDCEEQQAPVDDVDLFDPWDQEFQADIERRNSDFDF